MRKIALVAAIGAALLAAVAYRAGAEHGTLMDLLAGRNSPVCPRDQRTPQDACNVVIHRPGGNPTQDMTGSIGHAKSWQGNGGPRCKTICRFTGAQDR